DRAPHACGDGDFAPRGRARLRPENLRRHAGSRTQRSARDRRLSRRRRRGSRHGDRGGRAMTARPLLSIRGVKTFYGNIMALGGVDLDVGEGEIVTIIGANGAGKSTL